MDFPKRDTAHVAESDSLKILKAGLPSEWLIRELSERDYGIDLYVEIVGDSNELRGDMVALQLKSKRNIVFKAGVFLFKGIKRATINYWLSLPVPVFAVVVCLNSRRCFWVNIRELNRKGVFQGQSKTISIKISKQLSFDIYGTTRFQLAYFLEKRWPAVEAAIEKSLMLYNTLGPLVLMCQRSTEDEPCSTTLQYLVNDHYENYSIMTLYLLGKAPVRLPHWYDKNIEHLASNKLSPSYTFYYKTMKEMFDAILSDYRKCLLVAYQLVTEEQQYYFSRRFVYLCMHLKDRPHTFVADDWYARYYFDEYGHETSDPEQLYFQDFDHFDRMLDEIGRS